MKEVENTTVIKILTERIKKNWHYFLDGLSRFKPSNIKRFFKSLTLKKIKEKINSLKWSKIDSYIFKKFIISLFGSLFLFIAIYILTMFFQEMRYFPEGVETGILLQYYLLHSTYWIVILQPLSFLFATVYVLSTLARTKELIAIVSTGTSLYRISFYMVLFSILYCVLMMGVVQDKLVFPAYQRSYVLREIIFRRATPESLDRLKDNKNFSIFGSNRLLYVVEKYDAVTKELKNITIVQFTDKSKISDEAAEKISDEDLWFTENIDEIKRRRDLLYTYNINIQARIDAQRAVWDSANGTWKLFNGTIRYVDSGGMEFRVETFENRVFDFIVDEPFYFEKMWYSVDAMTSSEALRYVEMLKTTHQDYRDAEARYLAKFSYTIGIIMVVLTGIGIINIASRKISFIINLIISVVIFLIYYIFFAAGLALASKGDISPAFGAFVGSIFFALISTFLYTRTKT
jgi:lipopolysaccharide export LptBFGC system permease protein LptF